MKGSNCELSMKDTAVVENRTPQSGAILMRGSGAYVPCMAMAATCGC